MRERFAAVIANRAVLHRAGARIVCGTGAGVGPSKPHDVLPYGMSSSLPAIGMTNAGALTAATAVAAEVCGLANITAPLKRAMTLASWRSRATPLEGITAIHDVLAVFVRGARAPISI